MADAPLLFPSSDAPLITHTDAGAMVRSTLSTVAASVNKRRGNLAGRIKEALDLLGRNPKADPFAVLFFRLSPP